MLRLGRGIRIQYEKKARAHVLLFPEGVVDLNDSAHSILSKLPVSRGDLYRRLCTEFQVPDTSQLQGIDTFLEEAIRNRWVDETSNASVVEQHS